ncbi:hypothetical protein Y032_0501g2602 [Ancylostoma ceylanicum]|uniref:PDZ domain-containing protein n=1 Tax=Ancylostoma ceylanicum TaxID=53326 RepID=A0A016WTN4_9BILA|nr:hypothetical protein Y032_0501g2602 [Ancylostoma ceylanicum]
MNQSDEVAHCDCDHFGSSSQEERNPDEVYDSLSTDNSDTLAEDSACSNPDPQPIPINSQRTALLSRSNLGESFGFALQLVILHTSGDVVVAVNGFPVLAESHKTLVDLMSSQLKLHLVLLYQDITRILALSVRSLQLQYILAEKYILLEQMDMEEASLLHGSGGSLSTDFRRARWLSACQDISRSLNLCRKLLGRESKQDLYRLRDAPAESAGALTALEHNVELDDDCSQVTRL